MKRYKKQGARLLFSSCAYVFYLTLYSRSDNGAEAFSDIFSAVSEMHNRVSSGFIALDELSVAVSGNSPDVQTLTVFGYCYHCATPPTPRQPDSAVDSIGGTIVK